MAKVRLARPDEAPLLVAMGARLHDESPRYRGLVYSDEKCYALLDRLEDIGIALVAEQDGEIIGMMLGFAMPAFFSEGETAADLLLFVEPEYRGGSAAVKLVRAFEAWAQERGAVEIAVGVSTGIHAERTTQFYEHLGYDLIGTSLRKTCTQGTAVQA